MPELIPAPLGKHPGQRYLSRRIVLPAVLVFAALLSALMSSEVHAVPATPRPSAAAGSSSTPTADPAPESGAAAPSPFDVWSRLTGGGPLFSMTEPLSYNAYLRNSGPGPADGLSVAIEEPVWPRGIARFRVEVLGCQSTGGAVCPTDLTTTGRRETLLTGTVPTFPAGASLSIFLRATPVFSSTGGCGEADYATRLHLVVESPEGRADANPDNTDSWAAPARAHCSDVAVTQTPSATKVRPGQPLSFRIDVTTVICCNYEVMLTDSLPKGFVYEGALCRSATTPVVDPCLDGIRYDAARHRVTTSLWPTQDYIESGATRGSVIIRGRAGPDAARYVNVAKVQPAHFGHPAFDPRPASNCSCAVVRVTENAPAPPPPKADLTVTVTGPAAADRGTRILHTVDLTSRGPDVVYGAVLTVAVPEGMELSNGKPYCREKDGAVCPELTLRDGVFRGTIPRLPPSGSLTVFVYGWLPTTPVDVAATSARLTPPDGVRDPDPSSNEDELRTELTEPPRPTAHMTQSLTRSGDALNPNEPLTLTYTVANRGPHAVDGLSLGSTAKLASTVFDLVDSRLVDCRASGGVRCPDFLQPEHHLEIIDGNPAVRLVSGSIARFPAGARLSFSIELRATLTTRGCMEYRPLRDFWATNAEMVTNFSIWGPGVVWDTFPSPDEDIRANIAYADTPDLPLCPEDSSTLASSTITPASRPAAPLGILPGRSR